LKKQSVSTTKYADPRIFERAVLQTTLGACGRVRNQKQRSRATRLRRRLYIESAAFGDRAYRSNPSRCVQNRPPTTATQDRIATIGPSSAIPTDHRVPMARDARVNDRPSCALPTIRTAESATQREHLLERTNVSEIGETIVSVRDCDKMRTADAAGTSRNGGGDRFETFDLGYAVAPIPTHRTFEQRAFRLFRFFLWKSRRRVTGQRRRVRAGLAGFYSSEGQGRRLFTD